MHYMYNIINMIIMCIILYNNVYNKNIFQYNEKSRIIICDLGSDELLNTQMHI